MASEKKLTANQNRSDFNFGLECLETWRGLSSKFHAHLDEVYSSELKETLQKLIHLSETGAGLLQNYLTQNHPEPSPESPDGKLLRPDVPEWRPGPHVTSSSD